MTAATTERQDAILYLAVRRNKAEQIFSSLTVADFLPGFRQRLAAIAIDLLEEDGEVDPIKVMARCTAVGGEFSNFYMMLEQPLGDDPTSLITLVLEDSARRMWTATLTRAMQAIENPQSDVDTVIGDLARHMDAEGTTVGSTPTLSLDEILAIQDTARPWVIPKTLREGEVVLITGEEGSGKSMLMSQIALGAAYGVNSMSLLNSIHTPVKVFVIDVENEDIQIRDNMLRIYPFMRDLQPDTKPSITFSGMKFAELTNSRDRRKLIAEVTEAKPSLIIMGTVYKLAPVTDHEAAFNAVMSTVREMQRKTGAAAIIEHHAGNGFQGDRDNYRPYGSSMWRRWPNFGIGLVRTKEDWRIAELVRWRGDRARNRLWPAGVAEGPIFPWRPIPPDQWEALYKKDDDTPNRRK